jgi:2-polyprenyl-6-methoxyphenol hydroxylase-like FAD-dependent oxidoreductase
MPFATSSHSAVGIVGAGIAGLTLAIRLKQLGMQPVIFEARQRVALESEGAFLTLAPNGLNGLRPGGLYEDVVAAGIPTTAMEILGEHGKRLALIDQSDHERAFGAPSVTLGRGALLAILLRRAEALGVEIRLGQQIATASQSDQGVFIGVNGKEDRFDILVACDGLRSTVRRLFFAGYPEPRFTGLIGTGGFTHVPGLPATDGVMRLIFGYEAFFGYLKPEAGPVYWFNSYPSRSASGSGLEPRAYAEHLQRMHARDPHPVPEILASVAHIERDYPIFDMPELPAWSSGRVVLVGDAAHAAGPHAGQGASMAIEDAVVLARALASAPDYSSAFSRFETVRRGRVAKVVAATRRNGSQKQAVSSIARFLRSLMLPIFIPLGTRAARSFFALRIDRDDAGDGFSSGARKTA